MQEIFSQTGECLMRLKSLVDCNIARPVQFSQYTVLYIHYGEGTFYADFGAFPFVGPVLLFATPLQTLYLNAEFNGIMLQFHSDFYCIEYHRAEVACNGLLFNNIYLEPVVALSAPEAAVFSQLLDQLGAELLQADPSEIVLRAYLQLFLAKSSTVKKKGIANDDDAQQKDELMERFRELLDANYLTLHKPQEYAALLAISPNTLTKRCTKYFKKPPSHLITERLILDAKKQLHLTRKSIKEIAFALNFEDEFYFSRVFKKFTNVSPQAFRDMTGISIVADLYR